MMTLDGMIAGVMMSLAGLVLLAAVSVTLYSIIHSQRTVKRGRVENGVPVGRIAVGAVALPVVVAVPSLLFGSLADMCIITVLVLLVVSVALVAWGTVRTMRRARKLINR